MKKFNIFNILFILLAISVLSACQSEADPIQVTETQAATPAAERPTISPTPLATEFHAATSTTAPPTPTDTPLPAATDTPAFPTATSWPTETAVPIATDLSINESDVRLFPMPGIYSGDKVTFQVQPFVPNQIPVTTVHVDISINDQIVSSEALEWRNWAGHASGIFEWVWDTTGTAGPHQVKIVLDAKNEIIEGDENPDNNEVTFEVNVAKQGLRPLEERDATFISGETECCNVYALTRTAAYRDFPMLLEQVDQAIAQAVFKLDEDPQGKIDIFFIDRTIGQGGYAGNQMVVTYVDRPYIGGNLQELLVHEAVHVIDRQFAPQRTKFLAEGVAVWAAGGHYKQENVMQRAASLLAIGEYIPLSQLVEEFYPEQHEIGYLQAGAFVTYLIDQYGWPTFREFYSNTSEDDGPTVTDAMDVNFRTYYGKPFSEMEAEWLAALSALPEDPNEHENLKTTIRFYEVMRQYQALYDPSAHFLSAWLPRPHDVRGLGNTADFSRHPQEEINIILELMLQDAELALVESNHARSNVLLNSVEKILYQDGAFTDPLSVNYRDIVRTATNFGYEVQDVDFSGEIAKVLATTATGYHLTELNMELQKGDWILLSN